MNTQKIIHQYIDAWNARDVDAVLDLMHPGAAYYDAYWMETCVGRDLNRYLRDSMLFDKLWYVVTGDVITTSHGVIYRYSALDFTAGIIGDTIFNGAEIIKFHEGKMLTISNMYCSPAESELVELAELIADRHGQPRHANDGLSALNIARIRKRLTACLDDDEVCQDPDATLAEVAETIGCTVEELREVLEGHYQTTFDDLLDKHRIEVAKQLLVGDLDNPRFIEGVAASAGFKSTAEFRDKFSRMVGTTPTAYRRRQKTRVLPG